MYFRSAIGPLQEGMRASLSFSDNQMALLQGVAMALPMALGAIPIGLLADRVARSRLLRFFIVLSAASCVLSALASGFAALFASRCLAGLASAGTEISAFAMVSDYYAPAERGRASMIVASGEIVGAPVAFALGGTLLVMLQATPAMKIAGWGLANWRWSLLWMIGLLVPLITSVFFVRDVAYGEAAPKRPSLRAVLPDLWSYRAVGVPVLVARSMIWLADGAVFVWAAPNFARRFGLQPDRVGAIMGVVLLASGLLGPLLGGFISDFCQRRGGPRQTVRVLAILALLSVPTAAFALMPSVGWAAVVLGTFLTLGFTIGTGGVTLSIIVIPSHLRGCYLGLTVTLGALFFVGAAPLMVSMLAGALGGTAMIGQALAMVCATASILGALVFGISVRYFPAGEGR